jgi:hypothetical protein
MLPVDSLALNNERLRRGQVTKPAELLGYAKSRIERQERLSRDI